MATKKNLADLLREEVHKSPPVEGISNPHAPDAQSSQDAHPTEAAPQATPASGRVRRPKPTATKAIPRTAQQAARRTTRTTTQRSSTRTKADLERQVAELTAGLGAAQQQEVELQAQIQTLKTVLADLQNPQPIVPPGESLKTELDEAKNHALRLIQENKQLQKLVHDLQQENVDLKSQLRPVATRTPSAKAAITKTAPVQPPPTRLPASRSILERPVMPTRLPTQKGNNSNPFETWCYD